MQIENYKQGKAKLDTNTLHKIATMFEMRQLHSVWIYKGSLITILMDNSVRSINQENKAKLYLR